MMSAAEGAEHAHQAQSKGDNEFEDLESFIDKTQIQCFNADTNFGLESAIFDKSRNIYLKSDSDEQLIIQVGFNTPVRLHHLIFRAPSDNSAPHRIKLFVNQTNLDFSSCEGAQAVQEIELSAKDFDSQTDLRYVKFQNVKNLTIFVESNKGGEQTKISQIRFIGQTIHETNMNNFKQGGGCC